MSSIAMSFPMNTRNILPLRDRLRVMIRNLGVDAKGLARCTGRSPKQASNWLAGDSGMSAEALIELCRHFDDAWDEVCRLTGRDRESAERLLEEIAEKLGEKRNGPRRL